MNRIICDTNILIHHFNNDPATVAEMNKIGSENVLIPSIVIMELYRGMSNKKELLEMKKKLKHYNILHANNLVSKKAMQYIEDFRLSHDLQIPDAIIGAMAAAYELPLFTYNIKDFRFLPGIKLHT